MTQIKNNIEKLIVITRRDLIPAAQSVQSSHAAIKYTFEFPNHAKTWHDESQYLINLSVENEKSLQDVIDKLYQDNISFSEFREPDMDHELTAIAFLSNKKTKRITSGMPLMFKEFNKKLQIKKEVQNVQSNL